MSATYITFMENDVRALQIGVRDQYDNPYTLTQATYKILSKIVNNHGGDYVVPFVGSWAPSANYYVGDHVESHNDTFVCIQNNYSTTLNEPPTGANWATYWEETDGFLPAMVIDNTASVLVSTQVTSAAGDYDILWRLVKVVGSSEYVYNHKTRLKIEELQ